MKIPNCFVCDKELKNVGIIKPDEDINQPNDGLSLTTVGHYGSTVFDPMDPSRWLEINICDECITERKDRIIIGIRLPQGFVKPVMYEPWNPFKHN